MISLRKAREADLPIIQYIGTIAYGRTYVPILGQVQVDYMLNKIYAIASLTEQLMEGHIFIIAEVAGKDAAFASYSTLVENGHPVVKLHKLYVLPEAQGLSIGKFLINEVRDKAIELGAKGLLVNVNRYNKARDFYEKAGFKIKETVDIEIGDGFFMNDYVMERTL
ncbi:GNAT family N-acetyltransferase [Pedobacter hartonius]|uniref:L-amino acid N-acyltransferase YncA n=1 Tax=Pedobacter hartonius TaxID=425514 RepID=A0A1H3ZWZ5_9SPHI|nr:GNAT family N-acetyltransferase [Pedobacter hartonius]SEA27824.1 L-amino acid N-acyltransferase YncA [Pedobacter hartonius]